MRKMWSLEMEAGGGGGGGGVGYGEEVVGDGAKLGVVVDVGVHGEQLVKAGKGGAARGGSFDPGGVE
jgi:hypothetical protein